MAASPARVAGVQWRGQAALLSCGWAARVLRGMHASDGLVGLPRSNTAARPLSQGTWRGCESLTAQYGSGTACFGGGGVGLRPHGVLGRGMLYHIRDLRLAGPSQPCAAVLKGAVRAAGLQGEAQRGVQGTGPLTTKLTSEVTPYLRDSEP